MCPHQIQPEFKDLPVLRPSKIHEFYHIQFLERQDRQSIPTIGNDTNPDTASQSDYNPTNMSDVEQSSRDAPFLADDNNNDYTRPITILPTGSEIAQDKCNMEPSEQPTLQRSNHVPVPTIKVSLDNLPITQLKNVVRDLCKAAGRVQATRAE